MRLSQSIMAHPDRKAEVAELLYALDRPAAIHWDNEGPPSGNGDRVWRQARAAWMMHDPSADWHVLIQDDALPCQDMLAGLEQALSHAPAQALVSPYLGRGRTVPARWERMGAAADAKGAVWVRTMKLMWGVCLAVPVPLIPEMLAWCDTRAGVPDDMRVAGWFAHTRREVWYTWPSLVDHRTVPSLTKHRAADRIARRHLQGSALEINWDGPVVTDPMLTLRSGVRSGPSNVRSALRLSGQKGRTGA